MADTFHTASNSTHESHVKSLQVEFSPAYIITQHPATRSQISVSLIVSRFTSMEVCLSLFKDRCPAVVLSIAIFLSSLTPSHNARLDPDETWWLNPCSKQTQYRYGRSAAENQLRTFIDRIDTRFFKELRELYEQPAHHKQMRGSCIRVNNMLQSIRKTKNETEAKELFYDAMVQFAVFIDRLKKVPLQTDASFQVGRRRKLYEETKSNLKLLLCEYNDTLAKGDAVYLPPRTPRVPRINLRCLPKVMNHTEAFNVDVSFFRKLKKFFRQSRAILKKKKQNQARRRGLRHRRPKPSQ